MNSFPSDKNPLSVYIICLLPILLTKIKINQLKFNHNVNLHWLLIGIAQWSELYALEISKEWWTNLIMYSSINIKNQ